MGKRKKKKAKRLNEQQLLARRPLLQTVLNAANTPLGRLVIAEAMLHAANLLVRKPAAAAVTAEATQAVRSPSRLAAAAADLARTVLTAAAERLTEGIPPSPGQRKHGRGADGPDGKGDGRPRSSQRHDHDRPAAVLHSDSDGNAEAAARH